MSNTTTASYAASLSSLSTQISNNFVIVSSAIGIPLNLLSIFIYLRPNLNKTNMGFLYACQAFVDMTLLLVTLFLIRGSSFIFGTTVSNASDFVCKLLTFVRRFTLHISSWMCVVITADRFVFVIYKNR